MNSYIVIPARLQSTRLPRKLLLRETGKSLIQHTYEAARRARRPRGVCVAADAEEIAAEVRAFGGEVFLTSPDCASGTDRIAEVAPQLDDAEIIVNVQGDEPELSGETIDLAVQLLEEHPTAVMATLATPIRRREQLEDVACVKVVFGQGESQQTSGPHPGPLPIGSEPQGRRPEGEGEGGTLRVPRSESARFGRALYFSRSAIPQAREWRDELLTAEPANFYQHIGLYAYRREFLLRLAKLPRTPLEMLENLEQLRVLESGYEILVGVVDEPTIGIDTPADYAAFVARWRERNS